MVFDGAGRKALEIRATGTSIAATTTFKHDKVGNVIETKGPRDTGRPFDVRVSYDDRNRAVRTEDALGNVTTSAFDGAGNRVCEKRPLGGDPLGATGARGRTGAEIEALVCAGDHVTRWGYDEVSKVISVLDAASGEYTFVYDEARNLIAKQDANGNLTTYAYDVLDRRTDEWQHLDAHARVRERTGVPRGNETPPDPAHETGSLHWHAELDANGNPRTSADPKGLVTTTEYGVLNRLGHVTYDRPLLVAYPLLRSVTYAYDGNGNPDLVTEEKETAAGMVQEVTDPTYDALDRLWTEQRYDGKLVQYRYDHKGNRKEVIDPDGVSTSYDYDELDRLVTARTPEGATTYRYWPDGLEQGRSLPNGVEEGRCYDAAGQLKQLVTARGPIGADCSTTAQVVSQFAYGYDADGNRSAQLEQRTPPGAGAPRAVETTRYGYDRLDRLAGVRYDDGQTLLYRLDAVGNRTGERELTGQPVDIDLTSYTAGDPGALVRDVTGTFNRVDWLLARTDAKDAGKSSTFGWDLAGNLVTKTRAGQSRELRWDGRNALVAVFENGVSTGTYDYDAAGIRVKRRTASEQVEYVLDEKYVLQEARGDVAGHPAYRRYHYAEGPLSVTDSSGARFIGTDALGSTTDLTTMTGAVAAAHQYDAWGQYRNGTEPAATDPKLGYTGHQYDPETGLVYARARYYDPEIGIFISRDGFEGWLEDGPSLHRYAYAYGNPLGYVDEDGNVAYESAEAWERWQRQHAWTGEEVMEKMNADVDALGRDSADSFYREHGNNEFLRVMKGIGVAVVQTGGQIVAGLTGFATDPTVAVRGMMRLGVGAAEGVEDIQHGRYLEGSLKIVADTAQAVETGVGAYGAVRGMPWVRSKIAEEKAIPIRRQAAAERIVEEVKNGRAQASVARVPPRELIDSVERASQILEKHVADVRTLMAREQAGWEAGTARLAQRAANEPGFTAAMDRSGGPTGRTMEVSSLTTEAPNSLARVPDFASDQLAFKHYAKHVRGVDLSDPAMPVAKVGGADMAEFQSVGEYRSAARAFHSGAPRPGVLEAVRQKNGDVVRFEPGTGEFGVRTRRGVIRTYFRPTGTPATQMQYFLKQVFP